MVMFENEMTLKGNTGILPMGFGGKQIKIEMVSMILMMKFMLLCLPTAICARLLLIIN